MDQKGFTLIEVLICVAFIAILATISIPSFGKTIAKYRLKGSASTIYLSMKQAKSKAISTRIVPIVLFNIPNDTYTIFLDTSGNWALDASETIISSGSVDQGVDLYGSTFPSHTYGFNNMGFPKTPLIGPYEVYLRNSLGDYLGVRVTRLGSLSTISSQNGGITWN